MSTVFLFPHQDDEFGCFLFLANELEQKKKVHCVFLTSGKGSQGQQRNDESLHVLIKLGVAKESIHFIGSEKVIPDGQLCSYMERVFNSLCQILENVNPSNLYVPAYEGGHQDHDSAHILGIALKRKFPQLAVWQFPLYHGRLTTGKWFKVLSPIPENGVSEAYILKLSQKFSFLALCLQYPSQWKSWVGLWPNVLLKFLLNGKVHRQRTDNVNRPRSRAHSNSLLYERYNRMTHAEWHSALSAFVVETCGGWENSE